MAILSLAGIIHPVQSLSILTHPVIPHGDALASGSRRIDHDGARDGPLSAWNGYDSALNFSEETHGAPLHIGKAVVIAASVRDRL